uniref:Ig-like domain-containing protein n=1 Tax=Timema shepardi TaxID=629360 RepID=A0A7R9AU41_TIMSH|nr:unnamed protein product [Timema shepardi]
MLDQAAKEAARLPQEASLGVVFLNLKGYFRRGVLRTWYEHLVSTPAQNKLRSIRDAPEVLIVDDQGQPIYEKFYEEDSTIQLDCIVRHVSMTSSVVNWLHEYNQLNYDTTRGGIRSVSMTSSVVNWPHEYNKLNYDTTRGGIRHVSPFPLIPQSSEKATDYLPDKEGDRENKERNSLTTSSEAVCLLRDLQRMRTDLKCSVLRFYWFSHAEDYQAERTNVKTDLTEEGANSSLSVARVTKQDTGNYTCSISSTEFAVVYVHVLQGESLAELHHGNQGCLTWLSPASLIQSVAVDGATLPESLGILDTPRTSYVSTAMERSWNISCENHNGEKLEHLV